MMLWNGRWGCDPVIPKIYLTIATSWIVVGIISFIVQKNQLVKYPSINTCQVSWVRNTLVQNTKCPRFNPH